MEWQMLDEMRIAMQQQNYRGEYLHRRGDESNAYNIVHKFDGVKATELLRQLDGDMMEVLREADKVICYIPKSSESALNHAVPAAPFSQVNALDLQRIAQNYTAMKVGTARVAGLNTDIIELTGDTWRYSKRLWLEQETRLLLQSELRDASGNVLEQFRFTRIELGVTVAPTELIPTLRDERNVIQQTAFRESEANPNTDSLLSRTSWIPEGFSLTHAEHKSASRGWMEQRTYSDGLTSFSVFVEKDSQLANAQSAVAKMGATSALMVFQQGLGVTVIGEIPADTAKRIAEQVAAADPM
jgi:sigma-E factor negative regulatory protein RseB